MVLETLHFVVGADGRPTAVQMDIETWRKIVEALEDAEDVSLAREALAELQARHARFSPIARLGGGENGE